MPAGRPQARSYLQLHKPTISHTQQVTGASAIAVKINEDYEEPYRTAYSIVIVSCSREISWTEYQTRRNEEIIQNLVYFKCVI
jgi:hypothetical protein